MIWYSFSAIGIVRSPFSQAAGTPIQPTAAEGVQGEVILEKDYAPGLKDIDGFSHLFLLYVFDRSLPGALHVTPFLDDAERGVFATRAPCRPNPIGLSLVRLLRREGNVLRIAGVDVLDGTPLLDIKPYIPQLNPTGDIRVGWLTGRTEGFAGAVVTAGSGEAGGNGR
jgi:tRNA-Thr(GGU) m(6)t(6)A37 methyltransferase TsaA